MISMDVSSEPIIKMYLLGYSCEEIKAFFLPYLDEQIDSQDVLRIIEDSEGLVFEKHGQEPEPNLIDIEGVKLHLECEFKSTQDEDPFEQAHEGRTIRFPNNHETLSGILQHIHKLEQKGLQIKTYLMYPTLYFGDTEAEEIYGILDLHEAIEAGKEEGIYHFSNCSCGSPSCSGGSMIISLFRGDSLLLLDSSFRENKIFRLNRESYLTTLQKSINNIFEVQKHLRTKRNVDARVCFINTKPDFNQARHVYRERKNKKGFRTR